MVNNRPLFLGVDTDYALWFDGNLDSPDWVVGRKSTVEEEKFGTGYAFSNHDSVCPTFGGVWVELWNGEWIDSDVVVQCSMCKKYIFISQKFVPIT